MKAITTTLILHAALALTLKLLLGLSWAWPLVAAGLLMIHVVAYAATILTVLIAVGGVLDGLLKLIERKETQ